MTRANLTRYALTAPADRGIFDRIAEAYRNFDAWTAELRENKIDVQHELAVRDRLDEMEAELQRLESLHRATHKEAEAIARHYAALRAQRIYFRVLLLALLDAEDVWKDEQAAKARAKREKDNA